MRVSTDIYHLLAAGATAFALAIGWTIGCWLTSKLLALLK
jgi:hypothetical protein